MKDPRKPITEMSDRELQEGLYKNIRTITAMSRSTNGWLTFIGIVFVIQLLAILYVVSEMV